MFLIDEIEALSHKLGLRTDRLMYQTVPVGNCVNQFFVTESRAGRLVRQLEDHFKIADRSGPLGVRFSRIPK